MVTDGEHMSEGRVSARGEHVTFSQLELIISYFGRHANSVVGVSVDYNVQTEELDISGTPTDDESVERARIALQDAIAAAQYIRPADNMDMSA
jgi:hypothetical protein